MIETQTASHLKRKATIGLAALTLTFTQVAAAGEDLWTTGQETTVAPEQTAATSRPHTQASSIGISIGEHVTFKGIGTVFYAGRAGGEVYFASNNIPGGLTWPEALEACQKKGDGWALPTLEQLHLLYRHSDELDLYGLGVEPTSGNWYWSASSYDKDNAWRERFYDGHQLYTKKRYAARARCVRVY